MMTFYEFIAQRRKPTLPDPVTMLAKLGISPDVPHDIEILRMTKAMKRADAQGKTKPALASRTK
jgi:hypothetical protein